MAADNLNTMTTYASRPAWDVRLRSVSRARLAVPAGLAALMLLSLALRTNELGIGFWIDEGLSVGIADRPLADLMYRWPELDHSPLGLCICDAAPENSPLKRDHRDGVNMVLWHRDRFVYVLVGWADMDFLKAVAGELMPELAV